MENVMSKKYEEMLQTLPEIKKRLIDTESQLLYEARLKYFMNRNFYEYANTVFSIGRTWNIPQLDQKFQNGSYRRMVLWGCSTYGKYTRALLSYSKYADYPMVFVSNTPSRWGTFLSVELAENSIKTPVISPMQLAEECKDDLVLITACSGRHEIMDQLVNQPLALDMSQIVYMKQQFGYRLYGMTGHQYFDFFPPEAHEVFIDCGCLNGKTSIEFVKWCKGDYDGIVAFEPNPASARACQNTLLNNNLNNCAVIPKATWYREESLYFDTQTMYAPGGAHVRFDRSDAMDTIVTGDSIDHVLAGKKATFIKMDVEGSEYMSLLGAEKTIREYKPKLAISLYHKPEDIVEIPYIIFKYNPDYRFGIRQYCSTTAETVLYAF